MNFASTFGNQQAESAQKQEQTRNTNTLRLKIVVFAFPIALALIFLSLKIWSPEAYQIVIQEDTAIEWLQALFFFLASVFSALISAKFFKHHQPVHSILFGFLAAGLFFIAMEEISWGQRIFNIENTAYFNEKNMQKEITLHNLENVAPLLSKFYILIGLFGTFGWLLVSKTGLKQRIPFAKFYVPAWFISSYFFFVLFIYALLSYIRPFAVEVLGIEELQVGYFLIFRDQEPAEFLLSIGFLAFAALNFMKLKKMEKASRTLPAENFNFSSTSRLEKEDSTSLVRDRRPLAGERRKAPSAIKSKEKS